MADEKQSQQSQQSSKSSGKRSSRQGTSEEGLDTKPHFPVGDGEDVFDIDEAREKGWYGSRPMRHPDEEYTLQTGPDSPHSAEEGPE